MKKSLKVLLISLLALFVLFLLAIGFVWFNQDKIKQYAVTQLNEQLSAPISVSSIDITFIDQFPKVSLLLNDVTIADPLRPKRNLLKTKRLFIAFNLNDILTQHYNIKLIEADSGYCHLFTNLQNKVNYNVLKETDNAETDLFLELKQIQLRNMNIVYEDLYGKQMHQLDAENILLSGNFKGKKESLSATGTVFVKELKTGSVHIIKNKKMDIDIALDINEATSVYQFSKGNIHMGSLALECKGTITNKPKSTLLDITFNAEKLAITDLLELLPGNLSQSITRYKSKGNIYFNGLVKGELSAKKQPKIAIQFGIENGTLSASDNQVALHHINCKGEFSNGANQNAKSSYVILPVLSFQLGEGSFSGALNVNDFNNPFISIACKGNTSLQDLIQFTQTSVIEKAEGQLQFTIAMKGLLKNLQSKEGFLGCETDGQITCNASNIVFAEGKKTIEHFETDLSIKDKDLIIHNCTAQIDKSDVRIKGSLLNVIPYLLSPKQTVTANIDYQSNFINLEHILLPLPQTANNNNTFALPQSITVNANLTIAELVYHQFNAKKVTGTINWRGKKIETTKLHCNTMKGEITVDGQIENAPDGRFLIASNITCKQVDMYDLFTQCANFGQAEITNQHIRGNLNATVSMLGVWNADMNCDMDKLIATCQLHVTNGQLLNYKPLQALSKYINIDDLNNLRFADLTNTLEIKNKTITIPSMDVKNNALNMTVAGTHTFDNYMDYHLKLKLGDLLAKKYKKQTNEFEEATEDDGSSIFISMKGPADNLKFSYDKKQAREKVKEDLKKERTVVKDVWRKELGLDKPTEIKEKTSESEELEFEPE